MAIQRILRGTSATLTLNTFDANGSLADAGGAVTVGVTKADGTVVIAAGTAASHGTTGIYTTTVTPAQTLALNKLVATWACAADGTTFTTYHEIVGGYFFTLAEARASDPTLTDTTKYPDAFVLATRQEVEEECEAICDRAFVPRFARVQLDGSGTDRLVLPPNDIRAVRSVRTYPSGDLTGTYVALTSTQLNGLVSFPDGQLKRTDYAAWNEGIGNIVVETEYGFDFPPADLKRAAMIRLRARLNMNLTGIPDRAISLMVGDMGVYKLDTATAWKTGMPEVDGVYARYSLRLRDEAPPASRPMRLNDQKYSMWHGGN